MVMHPDKEIREQQQSVGFQPYSIKVGDTYIEYGRLDPIGMLIGLVADYGNIYSDNDKDREKVENNLLSFLVNQQTGAEEDLDMGNKISNMQSLHTKLDLKTLHLKLILKV